MCRLDIVVRHGCGIVDLAPFVVGIAIVIVVTLVVCCSCHGGRELVFVLRQIHQKVPGAGTMRADNDSRLSKKLYSLHQAEVFKVGVMYEGIIYIRYEKLSQTTNRPRFPPSLYTICFQLLGHNRFKLEIKRREGEKKYLKSDSGPPATVLIGWRWNFYRRLPPHVALIRAYDPLGCITSAKCMSGGLPPASVYLWWRSLQPVLYRRLETGVNSHLHFPF